MTKELKDLAWSALPKGNKVYCRNMYRTSHDGNVTDLLERLYGLHNLTSDAEGEEMLTVPRSQIQMWYASTKKINDSSSKDYINGVLNTLDTLFGSKCLPDEKGIAEKANCPEPKYHVGQRMYIKYINKIGTIDIVQGYNKEEDGIYYHLKVEPKGVASAREEYLQPYEEPKPAEPDEEQIAKNAHYSEPKYHIGEEVRYNGYVYEIEGLVGKNRYALKGLNFDLDEDMIDPYEPYTEPEEESRDLSQNIANYYKMSDNSLKGSFLKERRLTIAAMVMQGILSNPTVMNGPELIDGDEEIAAMWSLNFADALIAECEKHKQPNLF